jgi:non-specific serine/threonine protein kinase
MGIVEQTDRPVVEVLSSVIRNRRILLILDNLEHLLTETGLIAELLEACPNLAVLATSRTRLNLSGEYEHHVVPLTVPHQASNMAQPSWVEAAGNATAVQLFVDRARAVTPAFALTAENASAVAAIVSAVDGLPLAIELVAAQTRLFSPTELLKRMGRRLPLLTGGPRDRPKRHQTMADAIAWSYDLLSVDEQVLFRRLSVFVGGCTLEAAEAVADLGEPSSILSMISSLVDHQLLIMTGQPGGAARFTMLETIREFAGERLTESGDRPACHRRHASFFLSLAEQNQLGEVLPDGESVVAILDAEQANLRAALTWLDESSDGETFLQLAGALGIYWSGQGMYQEGQYWLECALAHPAATRFQDRATALTRLGMIELYQGVYPRAERHLTEALALSQTSGGDFNVAQVLLGLGAAAIQRGDQERGTALLEECRTAAQLLADRRLGEIMTGWVLGNLAVVSRAQGDLAQATLYLEDGLERMRRVSYIRGMTFILADLGDVMLDQGKHARALSLYREALSLAQANPGTRTVVQLIESVAMVAAAAMRFELCARLLGAADALRERIGLGYRVAESEAAVAKALATARAKLGVEAFTTVWAEGRSLSPGEAVAEARNPAVIPTSTTLTRREAEILQLISAGMTDSAIAETLFIGVRTVQNHVAHIFAKLGVRTRAAATQAAGLMPPTPRTRD